MGRNEGGRSRCSIGVAIGGIAVTFAILTGVSLAQVAPQKAKVPVTVSYAPIIDRTFQLRHVSAAITSEDGKTLESKGYVKLGSATISYPAPSEKGEKARGSVQEMLLKEATARGGDVVFIETANAPSMIPSGSLTNGSCNDWATERHTECHNNYYVGRTDRVCETVYDQGSCISWKQVPLLVPGLATAGSVWRHIGEDKQDLMSIGLPTAARLGNVNLVNRLLQLGTPVNEADATVPFNSDESGATPLHLAVRFDQPEVAKILLDHGADVNARSQSGMTPLMEATSKSRRPRFDEEMVKSLVTRGAKFEAEDAFGLTPLRPAIFSTPADVEELKLLVSLGANVNWQGRKVHRISGYADHIISDGETYLMEAVEVGRLDAVKALLACGADKSLRDDSGYNAEFYSSRDAPGGKNWREHLQGDKKEIYELVSQPGVPYVRESDSIERLYKEQGADVNAKNISGDTLLHKAASADDKEATALLLAHGADVNARDDMGWTPLHRAHQADESELLLAHGADVNARDNKGQTPLHNAASDDPKDFKGKGVLKLATEWDLARIEVLLAHGADVNAKDNDGRTPLSYAKIGDIDKLLREHVGHK